MLRFISDEKGVMDLCLSNIALIIAAGIIIAAVFSFIYYNEWNRNAELKNMCSGLSIVVEGMDTRFFENTTSYFFPEKDYNYNVSVSTEYVIVNADGTWGNTLSVKYRFLVCPWPRVDNSDWVSGDELHDYLENTYGQSGNKSEPIQGANVVSVQNYLDDEREQASYDLVFEPFYVNIIKPVIIEKVFIYYDSDRNNVWDKGTDDLQEFIIIYQKI